MLLEEKVAELLRRCEAACREELTQTRGNLRHADTRAAAVWELLVIEAASHVGIVEYEPLAGPSPDIRLHIENAGPVWIEAAFLHPRFWKEERLTRDVEGWLWEEARRRGVAPFRISPRFDGAVRAAGPVRVLPGQHERFKFLSQPELVQFFARIAESPEAAHSVALSQYTVAVVYSPLASGPFVTSGGFAQEAPTVVTEHAVYRALRDKGKRHKVADPLIICLGSDRSPALSDSRGPGVISRRDAIRSAFREYPSLSAVIAVSIETIPVVFGQLRRRARVDVFLNDRPLHQLRPKQIEGLLCLEFNRWRFDDSLDKWEPKQEHRRSRVTGPIVWRPGGMSLEVEIPANVVVDALAGKNSVAEAFGLESNHQIARVLREGWAIVSCSLIDGNVEAGEAARVKLTLVAPPLAAYWRGRREGTP